MRACGAPVTTRICAVMVSLPTGSAWPTPTTPSGAAVLRGGPLLVRSFVAPSQPLHGGPLLVRSFVAPSQVPLHGGPLLVRSFVAPSQVPLRGGPLLVRSFV